MTPLVANDELRLSPFVVEGDENNLDIYYKSFINRGTCYTE